MKESSQPPDLTGSGDGAHEGVFVEKSDQNPGGNPSLSSSAEAHGGHSMEPDSGGGIPQQVQEGPAGEPNGAKVDPLTGNAGRIPDQRSTQVQTRGGEEVTEQGNQAGSLDRTNSDSVRGSGYAPGWSYARAGTLAAIPVLASASTGTPVPTGATLPPGTTGMRGRGQGAENTAGFTPGARSVWRGPLRARSLRSESSGNGGAIGTIDE